MRGMYSAKVVAVVPKQLGSEQNFVKCGFSSER